MVQRHAVLAMPLPLSGTAVNRSSQLPAAAYTANTWLIGDWWRTWGRPGAAPRGAIEVIVVDHLCVKVGLRFCTNAPMPSFWSSSAQHDLQII